MAGTFFLMAALFESWFYPAVIITAMPPGGIGGLLASTVVTLVLVPLLLGLCPRKPRPPNAPFASQKQVRLS